MTAASKNGRYFWLLNILVIITVFAIYLNSMLVKGQYTPYRFQLNTVPHYVSNGFSPSGDFAGALEFPAGSNAGASSLSQGQRMFLQPGELPYQEFTITTFFDYTAQYDQLALNSHVLPAILLPGLGDNYQIYLNGHLVASEWHVEDGRITLHKLARGTVYPLNPGFFVRGQNVLAYRVFGDPSSFDTGLTVTEKYGIYDINNLSLFNAPQTVFAGIYLAMAVTFLVFFLLYHEKRLNLWFSATAFAMSFYSMFRAGLFLSIFADYELALRLEVISLFSFAYFITVLIYACAKESFNLGMKICTGLYLGFCLAVFLPGHQFVLDLIKVFFVLLVPFSIYSFILLLCIPLGREVKAAAQNGEPALTYLLDALSGSLRGNMVIASFVPIVLAVIDQTAYIIASYQEVTLSQFGFLFFFANVAFALAADNAQMHGKLLALSEELRMLISEREYQLAKKSGEIEEAKSAQQNFCDIVSKDIRLPLGEIIGAIELRMLRGGLSADAAGWLSRLLEAQRNIRVKLDGFLDQAGRPLEDDKPVYNFEDVESSYRQTAAVANPGGTRHLFVINPKSFVRLRDLKGFLLSIEKCFSAGHRAEYKIYISRYPRDAYSAVYRYLSATPPDETARVYAVGGDGILFDCLNGLAHFPNAELAPIPYGNANDFVRSFGEENMELFRNVKLMSKAPSRLADIILCGQQYALCSCSIGIEAKAVQVFSRAIELINSGKARRFVPLLYKLGAVKALLDGSQNNINYRLKIDGEDVSGKYLFINVGNIALNGGSNAPNPLANPDDGILDIITCSSSSVLNSLRMITAYTSGQFFKHPDYLKHGRLLEMSCESDSLMSVILDGETFYTHELDIKILPNAVKIVSPHGIGFADFSSLAKGAEQ